MLDGSPVLSEDNIGNVENNQPLISGPDGVNLGPNPGSRARQALLKKGGRKLRSAAPLHLHHKPPKNSPNTRLSDHNNNNSSSSLPASSAAQPGTEPPAGTLHHLKQGAKKELLKSKGVRLERGAVQPGNQPARNLPRHDQITQNMITRSHKPKPVQNQNPGASHSTKKKESSSPSKPLLHQQSQKKPLHASDNVNSVDTPPAETTPEDLKDSEKVYAGAKFSEPPSPSVLPKPPSHWVGEKHSQQSNRSREQMSVHLKSLLKVQDKS